jgi:hypothetical protein
MTDTEKSSLDTGQRPELVHGKYLMKRIVWDYQIDQLPTDVHKVVARGLCAKEEWILGDTYFSDGKEEDKL